MARRERRRGRPLSAVAKGTERVGGWRQGEARELAPAKSSAASRAVFLQDLSSQTSRVDQENQTKAT